LVTNVEGTVWRQHWREAAKGFAGGGIDGAMDLSHVRREVRRCQAAGKNDMAAMIKVVAAGGIWTRRRRIEAGYMTSPTCSRCGVAEEDEWHAGYSCIDNCRWSEGKDSQHIVEQALSEGTSTPCLWLRGLIPESMRPNAPHPVDNGWRDHGLRQGWFVPWEGDSGWTVLAGDASGGRYTSMARYRRVGVGLSQVGWGTAEESAWASFHMQGKRQEVVDGEEMALLVALQLTYTNLISHHGPAVSLGLHPAEGLERPT
jgi:hypothetical protein